MYIKLTNGVPTDYTLYKLRQDYPNTSFPSVIPDSVLSEYDVYPVTFLVEPSIDANTHRLERLEPRLVDGKWVRGWSVLPLTAEESNDRRTSFNGRIKEEASKRIIAIAPEWKQSNMLARAITLLRKGEANLTTAEALEVSKMDAVWAEIQRIRSVSDTLEAVEPPLEDYADDRHWV